MSHNDDYEAAATPVNCLMKKISSMFYESLNLESIPDQAMRPGGLKLTKGALELIGLQPGSKVLDVACGAGATLLTLVEDFRCYVCGLDLSIKLLKRAMTKLSSKGYDLLAHLICADSEFMPMREQSFDVVICECSLSLFPNKLKALEEMARILRRGGKVVITDVTVRDHTVKEAIGVAWCMCIAGAETLEGYIELIERAGLNVICSKDVSEVYDWDSVDEEVRKTLEGKIGYAIIVGVKS
ncbi:MAG: methyltransferase domain-containing protein [Candidatus Nezhaarchaeota archaeon]|nr:methyltransferase domain-containing protein [Candidatus Nezhaarchaeota archaeon]